jgi:hypothetical protein
MSKLPTKPGNDTLPAFTVESFFAIWEAIAEALGALLAALDSKQQPYVAMQGTL